MACSVKSASPCLDAVSCVGHHRNLPLSHRFLSGRGGRSPARTLWVATCFSFHRPLKSCDDGSVSGSAPVRNLTRCSRMSSLSRRRRRGCGFWRRWGWGAWVGWSEGTVRTTPSRRWLELESHGMSVLIVGHGILRAMAYVIGAYARNLFFQTK